MNCLQSQFHPDRFDPVQMFQKMQHIFSKTVRPCGHRQNFYIRIPDGPGKNIFHGVVPAYHVMDGGIITVNTETAAALGIDYSAFNDLAGQVVEVTTAE